MLYLEKKVGDDGEVMRISLTDIRLRDSQLCLNVGYLVNDVSNNNPICYCFVVEICKIDY